MAFTVLQTDWNRLQAESRYKLEETQTMMISLYMIQLETINGIHQLVFRSYPNILKNCPLSFVYECCRRLRRNVVAFCHPMPNSGIYMHVSHTSECYQHDESYFMVHHVAQSFIENRVIHCSSARSRSGTQTCPWVVERKRQRSWLDCWWRCAGRRNSSGAPLRPFHSVWRYIFARQTGFTCCLTS